MLFPQGVEAIEIKETKRFDNSCFYLKFGPGILSTLKMAMIVLSEFKIWTRFGIF